MEELVFEKKQKTKIKVSLYGETYELHKPTVKDAEMFSQHGDVEQNGLQYSKKFLAGLGLPEEISSEMELEHFQQLLDFVLGTAKKK